MITLLWDLSTDDWEPKAAAGSPGKSNAKWHKLSSIYGKNWTHFVQYRRNPSKGADSTYLNQLCHKKHTSNQCCAQRTAASFSGVVAFDAFDDEAPFAAAGGLLAVSEQFQAASSWESNGSTAGAFELNQPRFSLSIKMNQVTTKTDVLTASKELHYKYEQKLGVCVEYIV